MKKLIFTLLHIYFFSISHAQTSNITEANNFIEKINNKLNTIHAAEFLVKKIWPIETGKTKPFIEENKGFFKIDTLDKVEGCKYFFQLRDDKFLYDGTNSYYGGIGALYITNAKKYPEEARIRFMKPNPFQNLLKLFLEDYGNTPKEIIHNCEKFAMEINISVDEKDNIAYNVITCKRTLVLNSIVIPETITTLYTTSDFIPVKFIIIYLDSMKKSEYNIEKYTLLEDLPDDAFSPLLLGENYSDERYYQGEEKGYVSNRED